MSVDEKTSTAIAKHLPPENNTKGSYRLVLYDNGSILQRTRLSSRVVDHMLANDLAGNIR